MVDVVISHFVTNCDEVKI